MQSWFSEWSERLAKGFHATLNSTQSNLALKLSLGFDRAQLNKPSEISQPSCNSLSPVLRVQVELQIKQIGKVAKSKSVKKLRSTSRNLYFSELTKWELSRLETMSIFADFVAKERRGGCQMRHFHWSGWLPSNLVLVPDFKLISSTIVTFN